MTTRIVVKRKPIEPGTRFGFLTVIKLSHIKNRYRLYNCICDCGKYKLVKGANMTQGWTRSCGHLQSKTTHGHSIIGHMTPEYITWTSMKRRCMNPRAPGFERYGGRGISVCARWNSFENFLADMGARPAGKTIDRINNDGNYEPSNCRWATSKQQAENRRPYPAHRKKSLKRPVPHGTPVP